ncbi:MAG: HD domain-containing protein [Actinomycetota bacterium]
MDHRQLVSLAEALDADLGARIDFLLEIDKLKTVIRRSRIMDGSRYENTAEHSWHLAMAVMILAPHANEDIDVVRAMELLLVHDLVEIDAGDTYVYDDDGNSHKQAREQAAADRIFNLLPADQAAYIAELWDEYERADTPTARFAYAIDRMQPVLLNAGSGGSSWVENGIRHSQALGVNAPVSGGSDLLWRYVQSILGAGADAGLLGDDRDDRSAELASD